MLFEAPARTITPVPALIEMPQPPSRAPAPSRRRAQAWLAAHLTDLSLAAAYNAAPLDRRASLDSSPWAVIDDDRLKHVVACNKLAWKQGVRPGHRMNAAIAFCSSLTLLARDRRTETELLERIATDCLKYTSAVSVQPPNEILLEVRGSLRLFGGPGALIDRVQTDFAKLSTGLQLALAPTARSALWLARASREPRVCLPRQLPDVLSSLPIASLHWPLPVELQLTRFGVTAVGDLMRLSRKDLARRIGAGPVRELQQAMGRTNWLHRGWSTPPSYHDRMLLDFEIETTPLLEKMLERPLARLKRTLIGAARTIDEIAVTLKHREGATTLLIRLQHATADTSHLASLLHEHLDRLVLRAPVREVMIDAPRLLVARPHNHSLAMDPATRSDVPNASELKARLIEQLQSRLGVHAVRAVAVRAHHVPERAQCSNAPSPVAASATPPAHLPRRPLWLLREPKAATREYREGALQIESSPETIEAEAWEGTGVRRAYYRARTREGAECWIYRDLSSRDQWFVHGLFG
ncbi:Y-family DNA polymerase [Steroidobacter agaridevorans]|nr:DNA polymerase Y family protein [Steroidobacter agaridevorans]